MNFDEIIAMRKAFDSVKERQKKNIPPDFKEKIKRLKVVRESSVGNEELLKSTIKKIEENGIRVFSAKSKDDAVEIILKEIGSERLVVKSKSNVTKEIDLTAELESKGIEVIETDIGDRILQVLRCRPSHPTGPIAHLSAKMIAEGLSKLYNKDISEEPDDIVRFVRDEIRGYIEKAKIGITGANAITAEEGAILTSCVERIRGVSKTADVEKRFFKGVYSPKEIILVLLDNRRAEIINKGFKEMLYCIDCGNCLLHCPMYNTVGNYFASGKHLGGKGLAYICLSNEEFDKKLGLCLTCGYCRENCPLKIDIPSIIRQLRGDKLPSEIYYFLKSHLLWLYCTMRLKLS